MRGGLGVVFFPMLCPSPFLYLFGVAGMLREHYADNPLGRIAEDAVHCQAPVHPPGLRSNRRRDSSNGGEGLGSRQPSRLRSASAPVLLLLHFGDKMGTM